jgi:hypothetical protein
MPWAKTMPGHDFLALLAIKIFEIGFCHGAGAVPLDNFVD